MNKTNVLSVSGGKDSTAMYLLAMERGIEFRAVFADTGNEHKITLEYIRELPKRTGGPVIEWVTADFAEDISRKKRVIADKWARENVPEWKREQAIAALQPSGHQFLDLCKVHGRFPSTRARFCSSELKHEPIYRVHESLMDQGKTVISWQGVRAEESPRRAALPEMDWPAPNLCNYRPILRWTLDEVVAIHARHGLELNPLYQMGMNRVGCMPCIHSRKSEIKRIAELFPEYIEKVEIWEEQVRQAAKRNEATATFFAQDVTPLGRKTKSPQGIREVVRWAKTGPGGDVRQLTLDLGDDHQCLSAMGACE
ncbi:MAG: phosphoadenosine phosphosulfate reductase family protein [Magnetococcales bacterium]|nr:phosphoadenosine phosphosulfate reductase family protein [Magnetococcales bacterium]